MSKLRDLDASMDWVPSRSTSPDSMVDVHDMEVDHPFFHRLDGDASMEAVP